MIWFILSILSATGIFVTFKFVDKYKLPLLNVIIINYIVAALMGFLIDANFPIVSIVQSKWIIPAIIIGFNFIILFFIVGRAAQKVGISITTVASKMSVIIPMLFAIIAYNENITTIKLLSIIIALFAVSMSVYTKPDNKGTKNYWAMLLPLLLFFGMGANNSLLIYSKENYINSDLSSVFTSTTFSISLIFGLLIAIFKKGTFKGFGSVKTWIFGILLGAVNYGTVYFIFIALNAELLPNSATYGIVDIGVVLFTVLIGTIFFKEKLSKINIIGVVLAISTIIMLTFSDI